MRLTTNCRYGTRAMVELGLADSRDPVQLDRIAERQKTSPEYLVHLLAALKTAGLVRSVRGACGGYVLDKPPSGIKLIDICRVLEGTTAPLECVDDPRSCPDADLCVTRDLWARMKDVVDDVLESPTLQDLVDSRKHKQQAKKAMYHI